MNTGLQPLGKAIADAEQLNAGCDDGWEFVVVDCGDGLARIDVYDEDHELVVAGALF